MPHTPHNQSSVASRSGFGRTGRRSALAATTAIAFVAVGIVGIAPGAIAANADPSSWMPATPTNWSTVVSRTTTPDLPITSGVTEHSEVLDTVAGRQPVQLLDVDASDPNVRLGVVGAGDTLINPADEKPTSMAARTNAVAGINGGFFDINASGQPIAGQIVDGEIWKSPQRSHNGTFVVLKDGTSAIRDEEFSGAVAVNGQTHPLFSINWTSDATDDQITEITPRLGGPVDLTASTPVFAQGTSTDSGATITVTSIGQITSLPALGAGTAGLLASSTGGAWLTANVHVGDKVSVSHAIAPDNNIQQLLQGPGQQLIKDGELTSDLAIGNPGGTNPETVIGISKDGKKVVMAALDGRGVSSVAIGPTVPQVAGYLKDQGVDSALLLDGGGSTTLVARQPGDSAVSIMNSPSDSGGVERPVGNGIFVYSTAKDAGAATTASVNGGKPVTGIVGFPIPVRAYTLDAKGNPATGSEPTVTADPSSLCSWSKGTFTPGKAGTGTLTVKQGSATATVPITVVASLASLSATPASPDLNNGDTVSISLAGKAADGTAAPVPSGAADWKVSDPDLGTIDAATGVFTAAASGSGLETITVSAAGAATTISVGVGSKSQELDPMNDSTAWKYNISKASATETTDPDVPPGSTSTSSIRLDYSMPGASGVHQMVLSPKNTITIDKNASGQNPTALAVWIKDDDPVHNAFQFATSYTQGNGQTATLYNAGVAYNGWSLLKTALPAGTVFPLTLSFVDMLSINPTLASTGTMRLSSLQVLYAARTPEAPDYTPIPDNPSWLQYEESPADFSAGGQTILMGDDAHLLADDPAGASSNVMSDIASVVNGTGYTGTDGQQAAALPDVAVPDLVQTLGDMADNGDLPNLQYAAQKISALGLPFHDLVGNHEITQGAKPENGDFNQTFGETHYAYTLGHATVIASDNSHGGITSSDPFQTPNEPQYTWLVNQLDAAATQVVIVAIHMPAYDPFPAKNSQFTDRWEAQQYLQLVQNYKTAHPDKHVIMVYGHARGFAEQILDPQGDQLSGDAGIPQFTFGDLGMPAYTTPDEGGFYHYGLVHIANDGTVQFAVQPVLQSLTIDGSASPMAVSGDVTGDATGGVSSDGALEAKAATDAELTVGDSVTLSASGVNQTGDNLDPVTVPVADPMSHVWSSSDPKVATVDAVSGKVSAVGAGTATISVTAGGMSADRSVTVDAAPAGPGDGSNPGDGTNPADGSNPGDGTNPADGSHGSVPADASGSSHNGDLASTGLNVTVWVSILILVLGAGGALLIIARRRRRNA